MLFLFGGNYSRNTARGIIIPFGCFPTRGREIHIDKKKKIRKKRRQHNTEIDTSSYLDWRLTNIWEGRKGWKKYLGSKKKKRSTRNSPASTLNFGTRSNNKIGAIKHCRVLECRCIIYRFD